MIQTDVIIVGGGPAGAACAWRLRQNNVNCLVLDQHRFPRFKPCAGWITPQVVKDLELNPADYPYGFTTFSGVRYYIFGLKLKVPSHQHAIRRYEFDYWLLERSGAPFYQHSVRTIAQAGNGYVIDGEFAGKYLVGAGGTYCPVYRTLFKPGSPKARETQIAAQEDEFLCEHLDGDCRLWFYENHLDGYSWYVPKANGYVNVGVGGSADNMNANGGLKSHWNHLVEKLDQMGLVRDHIYKPSAHTYYLRQRQDEVHRDNAFLVGDSAGLATHDLGEGIGPAIKSGLLAADAIIHGADYSLDAIPSYSAFPPIVMRFLSILR